VYAGGEGPFERSVRSKPGARRERSTPPSFERSPRSSAWRSKERSSPRGEPGGTARGGRPPSSGLARRAFIKSKGKGGRLRAGRLPEPAPASACHPEGSIALQADSVRSSSDLGPLDPRNLAPLMFHENPLIRIPHALSLISRIVHPHTLSLILYNIFSPGLPSALRATFARSPP
jgi:hypothetical protein